jgi:hypothetical protein
VVDVEPYVLGAAPGASFIVQDPNGDVGSGNPEEDDFVSPVDFIELERLPIESD